MERGNVGVTITPELMEFASPDERRRIEATLRRKQALLSPADFASATDKNYVDFRHTRLISDSIAALKPGENLIVSAPPRTGKTYICAIQTPQWVLANNSDARVGYVTYGKDLSNKSGRLVRDGLRSNRPLTPIVDESSRAIDDFAIKGARGGYFATSVGGALTGLGFDWLVFDDLLKDQEEALSAERLVSVWEWLTATAWTRREPGCRTIWISTRWALMDPVGQVLAGNLKGEFKFLNLPALALDGPDPALPVPEARGRITVLDGSLGRQPGESLVPERYTAEAFEELRNDDYWFEALFQGNPVPKKGKLFDTSRFLRVPSPLASAGRWFGIIDTANSLKTRADYTVFTVFCALKPADGKDQLLIRHVFRDRQETADHMAWVRECLAAIEPVKLGWIGVEDKTFGSVLLQSWRRGRLSTDPLFRPIKADLDKYTRASVAAGLLEQDYLAIPTTAESWIVDMMNECVAFPDPSVHDDIVDTLGYGAAAFIQMTGLVVRKPAPRARDMEDRTVKALRLRANRRRKRVRRISALQS